MTAAACNAALAGCRTLLIFGGSFDPPHFGHLRLPPIAARQVGADGLAYLPAQMSPFKRDRPPTAASHRLAMLRLGIDAIEAGIGERQAELVIHVLTDELDRDPAKPSYTIDTLTDLADQLPATVRLRLLIGGDQLRLFPKWREAARIVELAEPVVMVRPPDTPDTLLAALPDGESPDRWRPRLVEVPQLHISSTEIRRRIADGKAIDHLAPPGIARYIADHGLYRD